MTWIKVRQRHKEIIEMKNKQWVSLVASLLFFTSIFGQFARVQIIHNSPTPTVDIYANGDLLLNNFVFRTATPFIDVPAEVDISIGVAPKNSSSAADAIANFPINLMDGGTYVVVASGVVGGSLGFNLSIFDMAKETAPDDQVGLTFFHGSPDAPAVDIITGGSPIFDDVSFGEFSGILEVPSASYDIGVTPAADNSTVLASYEADFSFWKGKTAVVFASGFLSGADPGFQPWVALSTGGTFPLKAIPPPPAPGARAQILHNAGEAPLVDIYVNDDLLLDDFEYRTGTPFIDVPTNATLNIGVAPATSTSAADAIANFDVVFEDGKKYIIVAEGLLSGTPGFTLNVYDRGQEEAEEMDEFDLLLHHGSPDAPGVDIEVRGGGTLADDIEFGEFKGYRSIPAGSYNIDIKPAGSNAIVGTYTADLTGLEGFAAMAFASGRLGSADHDFGIFVLLADGTVIRLPEAQISRLQIIHNSPTPNVDIYVNGNLLLNKFVFRTATPFIDVPAGVDLDIAIAPAKSSSADDALVNYIVNLDAGETYIAIANGIVGGNPGFNLEIFDMGKETVDDDNVGLLFFHGSPDAPTVDITAGNAVLFDDVSFGEFSGYLEVPADSYEISVTPGNDNSTIVASYDARFGFWKGRTAVVFASGFLSGNDPSFEPWVALSTGGTFPLRPATSLLQPDDPQSRQLQIVNVAPNPASDWITAGLELNSEKMTTAFITNAQGIPVAQKDLGQLSSGKHNFEFNTSDLAPGFYHLHFQTDTQIISHKIVIAR